MYGTLLAFILGFLARGKNSNRDHVQEEPGKSQYKALPDGPIAVVSIPPPKSDKERADDEKDRRRKTIKFWVEVGGVLLLAIYTGFTIAIFFSSKESANAAISANAIATKSLTQIEKAEITVGRSDGVAAEFIMPDDPKEKAQLIVYFQNSGRSPAKFNWGTQSSVIASLPADPNVTRNTPDTFMKQPAIFETDHVFHPMWRAKNRKTGEFKWGGTIMIAGNSSYQGILWELPKERLSQFLNTDIPFTASGNFEFCDGFGNRVCRQFVLTHPRQFHNRLLLAFEDECPEWRMQEVPSLPDSDFLPACELPERRGELKGAFPNLPNPQ